MRLRRGLPCFVAIAAALFGQTDTGVITGLVTDSAGALVAGAAVTITGQDTHLQYRVTSNDSGLFTSPGLRTGRYRITVEKDGFRSETRTGLVVRVQDRVQANFALDVASTKSEITVNAQQPLLESETSSLGQVVEEQNIVRLPLNGRNIMGLGACPRIPEHRGNG